METWLEVTAMDVGPSLFRTQTPQGRVGPQGDIMRCGMSTQRLRLLLPPK